MASLTIDGCCGADGVGEPDGCLPDGCIRGGKEHTGGVGTRWSPLLLGLAATLVLGAGCATGGPGSLVPSPSSLPTVTVAPTTTRPTVHPTTARPTSSPATTSPNPTSPATTRPVTTQPVTTHPVTSPATTPSTPTPDCALPTALLGQDLTVLPGAGRVVALTFDAGADDTGVAPILATLAEKDAAATFFLTGDFARAFPESAGRIAGRYPIGNHTMSHPDLTTLGDAAVRKQVRAGATAIRGVTGVDPRPYFRFPFGAVDAHRIALVNDECYVPFRWTVDSLGWKGTEDGGSAAAVRQRVLKALRPGAIVLMHVGANPDDHTTFDADMLPALIDELRDRGYTLVSLAEALPASP